MPETIAAYIASATLTEASVLTFNQILAMTYVATTVAVVAANDYQRKKAASSARDAYNASLEDRLTMTATTNQARSRVYGRVRNTDGILFKGTHGANSEIYTLVVALAGHEVDAIEKIYFNDVEVTLDAYGYVQTAPYNKTNANSKVQNLVVNGAGVATVTVPGFIIAGSVSASWGNGSGEGDVSADSYTVSPDGHTATAQFNPAHGIAACTMTWQEANASSKARVRQYTGAPGQDLSTMLQPMFPSLITSAHKFAGMACLLVDLEYDTDAFPTGVPSITALLRGARVLDTRTGITAWTENPSLISRDWALYANGGACAVDDLAEASFIAAANACDTAQVFSVSSGSVTLPLYTCGIVCSTDANPWGTMQEIVESMAGKVGWAGGLLRVVAGVYRAPVLTITEDWLGGQEAIQIVPEVATDEAVNIYRPSIADAAQDYIAVPAPEVRATSYITADGRELSSEITLGGVTDTTHAQHVCGVMLRNARNGLTATLPCNLRAYSLELFDVVAVTLPRFGWATKQFEVVDWRFSLSGGVVLIVKETAAAIYTPDASFAVLDYTPNTALPDPATVPTVGTLTITSGTVGLSDGTATTRVNVAWPALADASVATVEVQYAEAADPFVWQTQSTDGTSLALVGLRSGKAHVFRARAVNALGVRGAWSMQASHTVPIPVVVKLPPAEPYGPSAVAEPFGIRLQCSKSTTADVVRYEWRVGATWSGATVLSADGGTSYLWAVQTFASYTLWVACVDSIGQYSIPVSFSYSLTVPSLSAYSASIVGADLQLDYAGTPGAFAIAGYEVRFGDVFASATVVGYFQITRHIRKVDWSGSRRWWVVPVDVKGNYGTPSSVDTVVTAPGAVTSSRTEVVDNNALLYWAAPATGSLPVDRYEVRKGASWASGTVVGSNGNSTFTAIFEQQAGVYTYWVAAYDSASNSGTPVGIVATIAQPPDYILRTQINSTFTGTLTNMFVEAGQLIGPVDTSESFATHFTSHGWASPQDQISAGYPLYIEPGLSSGSYDETFDYGAVLPSSTITVTVGTTAIAGTVTLSAQIYYKTALGDPWTAAPAGTLSVLATNFRYVRALLTFNATAGANLIALNSLTLKLASKLKTDSGAGTAAIGGSAVSFNVPFLSADTPLVQPDGSTPLIPVVIYSGGPNPTGFTVKLYNTSGADVGGTFSWTARGY